MRGIPDIDSPSTRRRMKRVLRAARVVDSKTSCWNWTRFTNSKGYGATRVNRRWFKAHRLSAWLYLGLDIHDKTLDVHHLCRNTSCFNPKHLEIRTSQGHSRWDD